MGFFRDRALVGLVRLIAPRLSPVSTLCYLAAIGWVLCFPLFARRTYISENALLPGAAAPTYNSADLTVIRSVMKDFVATFPTEYERDAAVAWVKKTIEEKLDISAFQQTFQVFNPIHKSHVIYNGTNVYSVLPAPKSDGKEAILISATYSEDMTSVATALSLLNLVRRSNWQHKDIIFLAMDGGAADIEIPGVPAAMKSFIESYHGVTPDTGVVGSAIVRRAGWVHAGLHIDLPGSGFKRVAILTGGVGGQVPNLDLVNVFALIAQRVTKLPVTLIGDEGWRLPGASTVVRYFPEAKTHMRLLENFAYFMRNQALSLPTGDHGVLLHYRIDAVTLKGVGSPTDASRRNLQLFGSTVEATVRSLNNILEHLHQSFYLYLLPDPAMYYSYGEYIIPLVLLVVSFVLRGINLLLSSGRGIRMPFCLSVLAGAHAVGLFSCLAWRLAVMVVAWATVPGVVADDVMHALALWYGLTVVATAAFLWLFLPVLDRHFRPSAAPPIEVKAAKDAIEVVEENLPALMLSLITKVENGTTNDWMVLKALALVEFSCICLCISLLNFSFALAAIILTATAYMPVLVKVEADTARVGGMRWMQFLALLMFSPLVAIPLYSVLQGWGPAGVMLTAATQFEVLPTLAAPFVLVVCLPVNLVMVSAMLYPAVVLPPVEKAKDL